MPVIPFEVDSVGDFVPQSHSNTLATLEQNKLQKEPDQLTLENLIQSDGFRINKKCQACPRRSFRSLVVEGELSNVHQAGSGHWYFVIKDEHSQLRDFVQTSSYETQLCA